MKKKYLLEGKKAIVTGSSRGIGKAIAIEMANQGCTVTINSRNSISEYDLLKKDFGFLKSLGDVSRSTEAKNVIENSLKQMGSLDFLICNVGSGKSVPIGEEDLSEWQRVLDLNFFSAINSISAALPYLKKSRGKIICISSICGVQKIDDAPITYSCAKAALNMYVKCYAPYLASFGITINSIAPGNIIFEGSSWQNKYVLNPEGIKNYIKSNVPLNRFGNPEEIASLVVYLCTKNSGFITGSTIPIDGGQLN